MAGSARRAACLRFGDGAGGARRDRGHRSTARALGELLALGSRRAAERIGGEAAGLAPHVKGLELPGYDPRALHTMALGLAVGTRGPTTTAPVPTRPTSPTAPTAVTAGAGSAPLAIETEDRAAVLDSLILCKFLRGVFTDLYAESAEMLARRHRLGRHRRRAPDGRPARRQRPQVRQPARGLDRRRGHPPRPLPRPTARARAGAPSLSRDRLDAMIAAYYTGRGWTADGRVPHALRRSLQLDGKAFGED